MTIIITVLILCMYSTISIIGTYWLTHMLLGKFKRYASYVVLGGYSIFILTNIFIWLYLYGPVYYNVNIYLT